MSDIPRPGTETAPERSARLHEESRPLLAGEKLLLGGSTASACRAASHRADRPRSTVQGVRGPRDRGHAQSEVPPIPHGDAPTTRASNPDPGHAKAGTVPQGKITGPARGRGQNTSSPQGARGATDVSDSDRARSHLPGDRNSSARPACQRGGAGRLPVDASSGTASSRQSARRRRRSGHTRPGSGMVRTASSAKLLPAALTTV